MNPGVIEEPVHESAPLARWIAERLCRVDPRTGESCAWYHGFRQYLRALDLAITPAHHAAFLRDAFATAVARGGRARVLVSGAIDYSMFAHVLWACRQNGASADVTVLDICDTPLFLNLWYSRRVGNPVRTVRASILDHENAGGYDVICTNAFFGQFPPEQRLALMTRWRDLLAPRGKVITVAPFRPGSGTGTVGFTQQEAKALRDAVLHAAQQQDGKLDLDPEGLARLADAFAARMRVHPVRSLKEIADLFEQGGFGLDHLSSAPVAPDNRVQLTGPTVSRSAEYALVVASRK
jgi:hypothetical protein